MSVKEKIAEIREKVPGNVTLIAVSKTRTISEIKEVYNEGICDFAENKVQELMDKVECFGEDVRWHFIGHLQTNKVKYIVGKVHLIHSIDSIKLLQEIEKQFAAKGVVANVLLQINIGKEEQKTGLEIEQLEEIIIACEKCKYVKVKGLMAIIPQGDEAECKLYFRKMKETYNELQKRNFNNIQMEFLSMGMSGDYISAIAEGSNMVRIGEGIFGKRKYNNK